MGRYEKTHQGVSFFEYSWRSFDFAQDDKSLCFCCLLDGSVEAGLLAGGGILLDDAFGRSLVDRLLRLEIGFLHGSGISQGDGFARVLDGAFHDTLHNLIAQGLVLRDAHVLPCILLDWHIVYDKSQPEAGPPVAEKLKNQNEKRWS